MLLCPACHHLHHISYPFFKWTPSEDPLLADTLFNHQAAWKIDSSLADIVRSSPQQSDKTLAFAELCCRMFCMSIVIAQNFQKYEVDAGKGCFSILFNLLQGSKGFV